jgi:AcrR family transcriptional regulator
MRKGEQTRSLILNQAVAYASEVGLEGLSIGSLATRLQLSKSGLFAHFGSKEELQLATLKSAQDLFVNKVFLPALDAPRGLPRLRTLVENWFRWLDASGQPGGCVILAAAAEFDDRPGLVRDTLLAGQKALRGAMAKAIRLAMESGDLSADTDPWQLAFELFGVVLAAHHDRHLFDDPRATERGMKAIERLLAANANAVIPMDKPGAKSARALRRQPAPDHAA